MVCPICKNKAEIKTTWQNYCNDCFVRVIEKRIRKYVRINKFFKKNDKVLVVDDLCEQVVRSIVKDLPLTIVKGNKGLDQKKIKKFDKVVIPWTLEDEICLFLSQFLSKTPDYSTLGRYKNEIKLFRPISEEELIIFAKIMKLKFKPRKKDNLTEMLDTLQKRYPETRFSILSSINQLIGVLK